MFLFLWRRHKFAKVQVEGGKILQESLGEVLTIAIIAIIMIIGSNNTEVPRMSENPVLWIRRQPSGGKEWIAEIIGRDPKYTYKREFLRPVGRNWSSSGRTGSTAFELEEGKIYEINEPYKGREFVEVRNGRIIIISPEEVLAKIS